MLRKKGCQTPPRLVHCKYNKAAGFMYCEDQRCPDCYVVCDTCMLSLPWTKYGPIIKKADTMWHETGNWDTEVARLFHISAILEDQCPRDITNNVQKNA